MSERQYHGKEEEKEHEKQEEKGRGFAEKYRRDPLGGVVVALCLIWGALVWIAAESGMLTDLSPTLEAWSVGLIGAGILVLLGVLVRLLVPDYRRPVGGNIILGVVLLGVGLGEVIGWIIIGPLILIGIAVAILVSVFGRRS